jgi:hypothetical protein
VYYLVDTGSAVSLINDAALDKQVLVTPFSVPVKAITNTIVPINGICKITLFKGSSHDNRPIGAHNFLVTSQKMPHFDGILGSDWFNMNNAVIDYGLSAILVDNFHIPFHIQIPQPSLSSLTLSKIDSIYNPMVNEVETVDSRISAIQPEGADVASAEGHMKILQGSSMVSPCIGDDKVTEGRGGEPREGFKEGQAQGQGGESCDGIEVGLAQGQGGGPCDGLEVTVEGQDIESCENQGMTRNSAMDQLKSAPSGPSDSKVRVYDGFNEDFHFFASSKDILPANSVGYISVCAPTKVLKNESRFALAETCLTNQPFLVGAALLDLKNPVLAVPYINMTDKPVQVQQGMLLAKGSFVHESAIFDGSIVDLPAQQLSTNSLTKATPRRKRKYDKSYFDDSSTMIAPSKQEGLVDLGDTLSKPKQQPQTAEEFDKRARKLIEDGLKRSECPDDLQPKLRQLLWKYKEILADKDDKPGYCDLYQPSINLDTDIPIYQPQYPIPYQMRRIINDTVAKFLKDGIVQHSNSPYNAPTIIVAKKDIGTRMCVDFRRLNSHLITDRHPLPRIAQILEQLGGAVYLTALDLLHGFYNLKINPSDRYKTAFSTPDGHYEFIRLPMGLKNSPSIFQRVMNLVLTNILGKYAFIYIDDIVIYSKTAEDHLQHLEMIFERLQRHGLKVKFSKCQLMQTQIEYLGFLVGKDGLHVNPKKVTAVRNFPTPTDVKAVQAFLGVVGYFRTFIFNFASKARGLYVLLRKEAPFTWGAEQQQSFEELKQALISAPVLALPDFEKPFILTTDASGYAIAAILTQLADNGKREHLISCHSRMLKGAELNYHTLDREIMAVYYGVEQNRSYLWGNKFIIRTDNLAIPYLERNKTSDSRRAIQWFIKLSEYDFTVEHRKGKTIPHADAFSRYPAMEPAADKKQKNQAYITAYISPQFLAPDYLPQLPDYVWEHHLKNVPKEQLPTGANVIQRDNLVYIKTDQGELLWVPPTLRTKLIQLHHEPPCSGHKGRRKTLKALSHTVYWSRMDRDVNQFIAKCSFCQRFKNYSSRSAPLKVTTIPANCFDEISLDVVGPLPISSNGNRYALCVQDRLSRWVLFTPMTNAGAETTCRIYLREWVTVYGPPKRLLTDRGSNFTSVYFDELAKFLGTKPTQTVAYRPQANGQNERTHRDFHQYISIYVEQGDRRHWDTLLKLASWSHNTAYHDVLRASPYEIVFGIKPNISKMWIPNKIDEIDESQLIEHFGLKKDNLERLRDAAKQAISRSQENFLMRQNNKRPALKYLQGQLVLVKQHRASKWAPKWDGPFEIKTVISENTFKIRRLHTNQEDTVHVDYIRPYYSRSGSPAIGNDAYFPDEPDERSDNINYDTEYLYEPNEDLVIDVETQASFLPSNKVSSSANPPSSPRVTRSKTRLSDQQPTHDIQPSGTQNQRVSTNPSTTHKSMLSRARASVKKVLSKHVSFPRGNVTSSSRQHFSDDVNEPASTNKTPVDRTAPSSTLRPPLSSPTSTVSDSNFTSKIPSVQLNDSALSTTTGASHPTLTIDIVSDQRQPVINKKITNTRQYKSSI